MKNFIPIIFMLITFGDYAQSTQSKTLYKGMFGAKIEQSIKNETDTLTYFWYGFQNQKYTQITDLGSIMFVDKKELLLFAETLIKFTEIEKGITQEEATKNYTITKYDFSNAIYVADKKGKYTTYSKKQAISFAEEIKTKFITYL